MSNQASTLESTPLRRGDLRGGTPKSATLRRAASENRLAPGAARGGTAPNARSHSPKIQNPQSKI